MMDLRSHSRQRCHLSPMKEWSHLNRKRFWTPAWSNREANLLKKAQCNGNIYSRRTPLGNQRRNCSTNSHQRSLRTRIHYTGEVLIGHVSQRGPVIQIPNTWDKLDVINMKFGSWGTLEVYVGSLHRNGSSGVTHFMSFSFRQCCLLYAMFYVFKFRLLSYQFPFIFDIIVIGFAYLKQPRNYQEAGEKLFNYYGSFLTRRESHLR